MLTTPGDTDGMNNWILSEIEDPERRERTRLEMEDKRVTERIRDEFVLSVRADLGSGKTNAVIDYIKPQDRLIYKYNARRPPGTPERKKIRILIVLPNINLVSKFVNDLAELGFQVYNAEEIVE